MKNLLGPQGLWALFSLSVGPLVCLVTRNSSEAKASKACWTGQSWKKKHTSNLQEPSHFLCGAPISRRSRRSLIVHECPPPSGSDLSRPRMHVCYVCMYKCTFASNDTNEGGCCSPERNFSACPTGRRSTSPSSSTPLSSARYIYVKMKI